MADSEDEVDVEDISEGEHLSKLRVSAVEDQKDNWYEKHIGNQSFLNPSDNSFSSDYCDPNSWLLDSNSVWSLDPCTDDKSRATIEKMILEEQMYVYRSATRKIEKSTVGDKRKQTAVGRSTSPKVKKQITKTAKETSVTHRKPWTVEEQEQFEQGLNLYGRSWTKIAAMISSRTSLQVKNYANQYFKQKNKNPAKMETCPVKATQLSCLESSCASNLEHVGAGGSGSKDEQMKEAIHCVKLSESIADEILDCESDDDIEINIDGSDSDEAGDQLMPGQTTSCPETVYSALIRAAAENPQDLITDETKSFSSDANDIAVSPEENSSYLEQYSESDVSQGISVIVDEKLAIETPISLSEVEIMSMDTGDLSCFSSFGEQDSSVDTSTLREESSLSEIPENHLAQEDEDRIDHGQRYCQNTAGHSPGNDSQKADTAVCNSVPTEVSSSLVQRHNDECVKFPRLDSATQMSTSACDEVKEKEWALVSCGDVTSCESIPAADREQPEASFNVSGATACERVVIDRLTVQYVEKDQNSEFFMGRALKTPERYIKIRNYILDMWEKNKPNYLFKTAVRAGLRNCGDVNSIGRVHAFLEDIGAINEGCFDRPVPRVRQQGEAPSDDKEDVHMESWVNFLRPRRKRQRIKEGDWVDINDSEGMTIQHLSPEEAVEQSRTSIEKTSPSPPRKKSPRNKPSYDPFLLVPCRKFPSCSAVPFDVRIQSEALVVMDAHAHLSTTEVIGLLGGEYFYESRTLKVSKAIPCRSLSTGLQCEMDPVSQTQASEELAGRGLAVVGWYHSHPTFAPIPSVRDIETQAKFQEWFGKGGAPFIGIIVSPYNYSNPSSQSQIRCLTVGEEWDAAGQYRLPYQFDYEVLSDVTEEDDTVEQVRGIADDYRRYPFRVQLNRRFGNSANFTMLDKLADSLRARLKTSEDERDAFLERLIEVIAANFKLQTPLQECRHDELSYDVEDNEAGATGEDCKSEPGNSDVTR